MALHTITELTPDDESVACLIAKGPAVYLAEITAYLRDLGYVVVTDPHYNPDCRGDDLRVTYIYRLWEQLGNRPLPKLFRRLRELFGPHVRSPADLTIGEADTLIRLMLTAHADQHTRDWKSRRAERADTSNASLTTKSQRHEANQD